MNLIVCDGCKRQISKEAPSCPHCGHSYEEAVEVVIENPCYDCGKSSTVICHGCGALSCVNHLELLLVSCYSKAQRNELLCKSCVDKEKERLADLDATGFDGCLLGTILIVVAFVFIFILMTVS